MLFPIPPPTTSSGPAPVPDHPVLGVPSVAGAVEAFFANRDLAPATRSNYRQALGPSSKPWVATVRLPT